MGFGRSFPGDSDASSSSPSAGLSFCWPGAFVRAVVAAVAHDPADARADVQVVGHLAPARAVIAQGPQVGDAHAGRIGPGQQANRAAQPVIRRQCAQLVRWWRRCRCRRASPSRGRARRRSAALRLVARRSRALPAGRRTWVARAVPATRMRSVPTQDGEPRRTRHVRQQPTPVPCDDHGPGARAPPVNAGGVCRPRIVRSGPGRSARTRAAKRLRGGLSSTGRASDCGSEGYGFETRRPPHPSPTGPARLARSGQGTMPWTDALPAWETQSLASSRTERQQQPPSPQQPGGHRQLPAPIGRPMVPHRAAWWP